MLELDHILWAAPDLDEGSRLFESLTGLAPARGGSHPGFGTRNSLVSLGDGTYFEIIAPDPDQSLTGNRGEQIAALARPGLLTFALRCNELSTIRTAAESAGLTIEGPVAMSRTRLDGVVLAWSILYLHHDVLREAVPFVIDWGASPHPSSTAPAGCRLHAFMALHPDPEPLVSIYRALGVPVEVKRAVRPGFMAVLATPNGDAVLLGPDA